MLLRKSDSIGRFFTSSGFSLCSHILDSERFGSVLMAVPGLIALSDRSGFLDVVCMQAVSRAKFSAVS